MVRVKEVVTLCVKRVPSSNLGPVWYLHEPGFASNRGAGSNLGSDFVALRDSRLKSKMPLPILIKKGDLTENHGDSSMGSMTPRWMLNRFLV